MREKPPFSRKILRECVRRGYATLSIDRELSEFLREFTSSTIGEFLEVKGFLVVVKGRPYLRFGLGIDARIELEGIDRRLVSVLLGEPVVVHGFKVRKNVLRVEKISVATIVSAKPYADYAYLKSVVLDGVELETPEDAVALCLISSPKQLPLLSAGGARQAVLGSCRSYLDRKLRLLTMSSRCVWKFGGVELGDLELVEKAFRRYAEVSADVEAESPLSVAETEMIDFPTIVSRAPRSPSSDFDAIDYTLWVKGIRPKIRPDAFKNLLETVSQELSRRIVSLGVDPGLKMFSVDYEARPSTVLRLAHAIARIHGSNDPSPFVSEALRLVEKSLDVFVTLIVSRPSKVIKVRDFEKAILRVLEKFEPRGATVEEVSRELSVKDVREVERVLEKLRRKGLVYCPRPGLYRVTPL